MFPMKQVIFVHGGQAFSNYNAFLEHLRTVELRNVLEEKPRRWKETLREELGNTYEVYLPSMPNSENAKYEEWKIWFERHLELVSDDVILVGHSQGGWFLVKYLLENEPAVRVRALLLVATPYEPEDFGGEDGGDFAFETGQLPQLAERAGEIAIFHSTDDFVVPYEHAQKYVAALPKVELNTFEDRGHFLQETFPELIDRIRAID